MTDDPKPKLSTNEAAEIEVRKFEARISLLKVVFGTALVGVIGVLIPGAVEFWSLGFQERRIQLETSIEREKNRQDFVSEYVTTALNEDIELRIRFAEYFAAVSDFESRQNWNQYLLDLQSKRRSVRAEIDDLEARIRKLYNSLEEEPPIDKQIEVAYLERRLEWLYREIGYVARGRSIVQSNEEREQAERSATATDQLSDESSRPGPPSAAIVVDPRDGSVVHSRNADTKLHPSSMTKLMTLFVVFDQLDQGILSWDQMVEIPSQATYIPPSKIGFQEGSKVSVSELVHAVAIKSANDAAMALAITVSGSEEAFAEKMNQTAVQLGMTNSSFLNAHGLTQKGHLSTARDLAVLTMAARERFPKLLSISVKESHLIRGRPIYNTCRRLLDYTEEIAFCRTGYTRASGYVIISIHNRDGEEALAVQFGGRSNASRNKKQMELIDLGFKRISK